MAFPYRSALVTGASAGFGVEFARQLAPHVERLVLLARRAERLEALRAELARPGLQIEIEAVDLADGEAVAAFLERLAPVELVVNNAGLGDHGLFQEGEWDRVEPMLKVNIEALTRLTHALLPGLLAARHGAILNVSSIAALIPVPQMAVYAATKAYVSSFTEALRAETRGTGVRVTAVCPGPVKTEFFAQAERATGQQYDAPAWFQVTPQTVVRTALNGVSRDRARVIPGALVFGAMMLVAALPLVLLRPGLRLRK